MIDLTVHEDVLSKAIQCAKENNIVIPTFAQMRDPVKYVPEKIKKAMVGVGTWDIDPINLFRITWKMNRPLRAVRMAA